MILEADVSIATNDCCDIWTGATNPVTSFLNSVPLCHCAVELNSS